SASTCPIVFRSQRTDETGAGLGRKTVVHPLFFGPMFDFTKRLRGSGSLVDPRDRLALFESLDRRASHTTLRDTQREALVELSKVHEARDAVLKLSTGGGKTTIALVHLYAYMLGARRPCVYVCPRRQLVRQVPQEA